MTEDFYLETARQMSGLLTRRYSTSFSLGIRMFPRQYRDAVSSVYGFVRVADEIVDTFHGRDKARLLAGLKADTFEAVRAGVSVNPVLHAFQDAVNRYGIDPGLIDAFMRSMEMDLTRKAYSREEYEEYIYGSAEAVGLMCLKIFCGRDEELYGRLKDPARRLGAAFQKVNFLRDFRSDREQRGRIYLPGAAGRDAFDDVLKRDMEEDIRNDFDAALPGIKALPKTARLAVFSVYLYYRALFDKLRRCSLDEVLKKRIRISNARKFMLLLRAMVEEVISPKGELR